MSKRNAILTNEELYNRASKKRKQEEKAFDQMVQKRILENDAWPYIGPKDIIELSRIFSTYSSSQLELEACSRNCKRQLLKLIGDISNTSVCSTTAISEPLTTNPIIFLGSSSSEENDTEGSEKNNSEEDNEEQKYDAIEKLMQSIEETQKKVSKSFSRWNKHRKEKIARNSGEIKKDGLNDEKIPKT